MSADRIPRHELVDTEPGYVIIERELKSQRPRAYFSSEPIPPREPYREGDATWNFWDMAQSLRYSVRDTSTGGITRFDELLGLLWWGCCDEGSEIRRIGELAAAVKIQLYIAIPYEGPDGHPVPLSAEKLTMLNHAFNERLRTPGKKILILPDLFGLLRQVSYGQIMLDFGLTTVGDASTTEASR